MATGMEVLERFKNDWLAGMPAADIAKRYRVAPDTLRGWRRTLGLPGRRGGLVFRRGMRWTDEHDAVVRERFAAGDTDRMIAALLGRTKGSVSGRRAALKLGNTPCYAAPRPRCIRCNVERRRGSPTGLCQSCYMAGDMDAPRSVPVPTKVPPPTMHLPGTPGKVEELVRRRAAGEHLWSEGDARRGA